MKNLEKFNPLVFIKFFLKMLTKWVKSVYYCMVNSVSVIKIKSCFSKSWSKNLVKWYGKFTKNSQVHCLQVF